MQLIYIYKAVPFVSDLIMAYTNIELLVISRHYFNAKHLENSAMMLNVHYRIEMNIRGR